MPKDSQNMCNELKSTVVCRAFCDFLIGISTHRIDHLLVNKTLTSPRLYFITSLTMNKTEFYLSRCAHAASASDMQFTLGSILVKGGKILSSGHNHHRYAIGTEYKKVVSRVSRTSWEPFLALTTMVLVQLIPSPVLYPFQCMQRCMRYITQLAG